SVPGLSFSPAATLNCAEIQADLEAQVSGSGPFSYNWTTIQGSILANPQTAMPTVNAPGFYTLEVTDQANGCSITDSLEVLQDIAPPSVEAGPVFLIDCQNTTVFLDGNGSSAGPSFSYQWTTTDGSILNGATSLSPEVGSAGTYVLEVTNTLNICTAIDSVIIQEDADLPTADAGLDALLGCDPSTLILDGSGSSQGTDFTYLWITTDGSILNGQNTLSPEIGSGGTYILTVENTLNGCTATDQMVVTEDFTAPQVDAGPDDALTCTVSELNLGGMVTGSMNPTTYQWTTVDGNIVSGATTLNPLVDAAGTYVLVVTDSLNGCIATDQMVVTTSSDIPTASVLSNDQLSCAVSSLVLDGSGSSQGAGFTFEWQTVGGNFVGGTNTLNPEVDAAGTYTLVITDTNNGCISTASVELIPDLDSGYWFHRQNSRPRFAI
ncbi:MAG: hypothetical protein AAFU60_14410, partial [Bacteroidota bacterium]